MTATNRMLIASHQGPLGSNDSSFALGMARVTLTNDQIKGLNTTPVLLVSNTDQTKDIMIVGGRIFLDARAGAYTNLTDFSYLVLCAPLPTQELELEVSSHAFTSSASRWSQARRVWADLIPCSFRFEDVDNSAPYSPPTSDQFQTTGGNDLYLALIGATNGDWTGGHSDNSMTVTVFYFLVDTQE